MCVCVQGGGGQTSLHPPNEVLARTHTNAHACTHVNTSNMQQCVCVCVGVKRWEDGDQTTTDVRVAVQSAAHFEIYLLWGP